MDERMFGIEGMRAGWAGEKPGSRLEVVDRFEREVFCVKFWLWLFWGATEKVLVLKVLVLALAARMPGLRAPTRRFLRGRVGSRQSRLRRSQRWQRGMAGVPSRPELDCEGCMSAELVLIKSSGPPVMKPSASPPATSASSEKTHLALAAEQLRQARWPPGGTNLTESMVCKY